jgi:hypothetical protein
LNVIILSRLQQLLTELYDAPVEHAVEDFLITDRSSLASLLPQHPHESADEQVFVVQTADDVRVGVYIDGQVLERLTQADPLKALSDENLHDYCTALEGVSHFHYLMWSLKRQRKVSLLELELQAEVDKYAGAVALFTRQRDGRLPPELHARLFHAVSFLPHLDAAARERYEEANRHAARFCRSLQERFLNPRRSRPEKWLAELRRFFRCGHQEKIRQLAV